MSWLKQDSDKQTRMVAIWSFLEACKPVFLEHFLKRKLCLLSLYFTQNNLMLSDSCGVPVICLLFLDLEHFAITKGYIIWQIFLWFFPVLASHFRNPASSLSSPISHILSPPVIPPSSPPPPPPPQTLLSRQQNHKDVLSTLLDYFSSEKSKELEFIKSQKPRLKRHIQILLCTWTSWFLFWTFLWSCCF